MRLAGKAPSPLWNGVAQGYRWVDGGLSLADRGMMERRVLWMIVATRRLSGITNR